MLRRCQDVCSRQHAPLAVWTPCRWLGGSTRRTEVILVKDSPLGLKGDIVPVKPGYARNWLIPQQWAVYAVKENREFLGLATGQDASMGNEKNARDLEIRKFMQHYSWRLRKVKLRFVRPKGADDELAVSVQPKHVLEKLANEHEFIGLTERSLVMEPIRKPGIYKIEILLNKGWVLPGIGLFGELEQLGSTRNPRITVNVGAQVIYSAEEKKKRDMPKNGSRKSYTRKAPSKRTQRRPRQKRGRSVTKQMHWVLRPR